MTDDDAHLDQPEDDGMELACPLIVCQSRGGPYEDVAFAAGWQAGEIDRSLVVAAAVGATEFKATVLTDLVKQLELVGMNRGFPSVGVEVSDEVPEWSRVTFRVAGVDLP